MAFYRAEAEILTSSEAFCGNIRRAQSAANRDILQNIKRKAADQRCWSAAFDIPMGKNTR